MPTRVSIDLLLHYEQEEIVHLVGIWNQIQELPNAPELQPRGEVTHVEFCGTIQEVQSSCDLSNWSMI